ncbi:MAG: hypothetical protein KF708_08800 [Pirellulales bacterium]|nr:hypothetical protein [Pirellulales bacterium]
MALDAYGKRYCEIKFLHHDRPDINRRAQEIVLIGSDGIVRNVTGSRMPHKVIFQPSKTKDGRSFVEILLDEPLGQRPTVSLVEGRPRWPTNRDILHMAIPLVALTVIRLMAAVVVAHP